MRGLLWIVLAVVALVALAVAPNALWLSRSSAVIHNTGARALTLRFAYFDDPERIVDIGELQPGESRFQWLDVVGEATLVVHIKDGAEWRLHCANYIEKGMYRVEVNADSPTQVECVVDLPIFDRLLILDYLS